MPQITPHKKRMRDLNVCIFSKHTVRGEVTHVVREADQKQDEA